MANVISGTPQPDYMLGTDENDVLLGYDGNDRLYGLGGNDVLQGGGDTGGFDDFLAGGTGNDTYLLPFTGLTSVIERSGEGIDTVYSPQDFVLPANVENLILIDPSLVAIGIGNELNNVITGNSAGNTLRGLGGNDTLNDNPNFDSNDTMIGGAGNDSYFVDTVNDIINEQTDSGSGVDTVRSTVSFSLVNSTNVIGAFENLTLLGSAANGLGNALSNVITGSAGNNLLNGGAGADTLRGLGGNDAYVVDSALDKVIEAANQGTDNVSASVSYTLAAGTVVETLRTVNAAATTAINLTGNNFANAVTGNAGSNVINGGTGNDTLRGNAGNDFFLFNTALSAAANVDIVADFVVVNDTIRLENAIFVGLAAGTLNADAFHIGAAAADAEDRIIYNSATGALSFDSNGNAAGGLTKFAQLTAGLLLTNADFAVI